MLLGFVLYHYFPFGGLERDFMRMAKDCHRRDHQIRVYALSWEGFKPDFIDLRLVPVKALQNHVLYRRFQSWVKTDLQKNPVDALMGFNKMPGLDFYYAADPCYRAKMQNRAFFHRLNPRFYAFCTYENAVFAKTASTHSLLLCELQKNDFKRFYQTPENRLHLLPPGITADRIRPEESLALAKRQTLRETFQIEDSDILLLMVGSGFKTKGLDRSLKALASLPTPIQKKTFLFVIGQDKQTPFLKLIAKLKLKDQVRFLGGREDVPDFLLAADLLLHPAYYETAGTILLESIVAGLPLIASAACGYAPYIEKANAGLVIAQPFSQQTFNQALLKAINDPQQRQAWQKSALTYTKTADIFNLIDHAVDLIEKILAEKLKTQ